MRKQVVVAALAWLAILCFVTCAAYADPIAYALTPTSSPRSDTRLATVDLTTGVYTPIGNTGIEDLDGLGSVGGHLYSVDLQFTNNFTQMLYSINASNGSVTAIGPPSGPFFDYNGFGSTTTGLFAVDIGTQNLLSINPSTGAATVVGPTGLTPGAVDGMSTGSSQLFLTELTGAGDVLYQLNTSTGAATMIGNTGVLFIASMVSTNGKLYAISSSSNFSDSVWTLDTTTGSATFVTNTSGAGNFAALGLAPTPVPEQPSTLLLMLGMCLLGGIGVLRPKLHL